MTDRFYGLSPILFYTGVNTNPEGYVLSENDYESFCRYAVEFREGEFSETQRPTGHEKRAGAPKDPAPFLPRANVGCRPCSVTPPAGTNLPYLRRRKTA